MPLGSPLFQLLLCRLTMQGAGKVNLFLCLKWVNEGNFYSWGFSLICLSAYTADIYSLVFRTILLHSVLTLKSLSSLEAFCFVCQCPFRLFVDRLAGPYPLPSNKPHTRKNVFFLILSFWACCCSVSIEAELSLSVTGPSGFFIKMLYEACKECQCVVCVCVCMYEYI